MILVLPRETLDFPASILYNGAMTKTQTFTEWYSKFQRDYFFGVYYKQRYGQAFSNALYAAGKIAQGNSLVNLRYDPFYSDTVHPDVLAFVERVWDWPQG